MTSLRGAVSVAVLFVIATMSAAAGTLTYDLGWSGSGGYTLQGQFSFDSSSAGDGRITAPELLSFSITGSLNGVPQRTWTLGVNPYVGAEAFNFQFDPIGKAFFLGGNSATSTGQNWNDDGNTGNSCGSTGVGFNAGSGGQDLCLNGVKVSTAEVLQPITATAVVPEPAAILLSISGLLGIGLLRRRS